MRAVIVGHGPSMIENEYGGVIDGCDLVVRQKRCSETLKHPAHFGTKTDIVCGSFTIATELPKDVPGADYWVFMDSRHTAIPDSMVAEYEKYIPCTIRRGLCDEWNERYRQARKSLKMYPGQEAKQTSDELGHTHMSAGLHSLIYTCDISRPDEVALVGFDNVKTGGFTWSVTRGPQWNQYPDHNWQTEHDLIPVIADHFGVEISFL